MREGYGLLQLRKDAVAGLTVAIVALPLSMAIAIASHVPPERGLYTAIIGGFLISALGGSRFQIGGPAGAFIVLMANTVDLYGVDGLLLATLMAGVIIFLIGILRLGTYIKYVPHPVTVGFTAGIAVIIFASQIKELLGLSLAGPEPAELIPKIETLWAAMPSLNAHAAGVALGAAAIILVLRKLRPHWPGFLIAVAVSALAVHFLGLQAETIATRFGGIPRSLPLPSLPSGITVERMIQLLPTAIAIAMLGSIESLLSAVVADSMSGRRHRSNIELVAQGIANVASSLFGGVAATGTIARTATNVRAGAHGPVSGILHAGFILAFMIIAAPLAGYIPLAALAAILGIVAWNMAEKAEFGRLITASRGDAAVLLVTFGLTVFRDLSEGIMAGVALGSLIFMHRMAQAIEVKRHVHVAERENEDDSDSFEPSLVTDPDIAVHRISGAFFFGAVSTVVTTLERIGSPKKGYILDFSLVPFVDYSAAHSLLGFAHKMSRHGGLVYVTGASASVRRDLTRFGLKAPLVHFGHSIAECAAAIHKSKAGT
jgi:SulP family sulfate permease